MTFYNVISAVIFVGAFRELLVALQDGHLVAVSRAALVALFVFNDAIFTSWTVETRQQKYGPLLMSIDLINFVVLSMALLFLNPTQTNVLQLDLNRLASSWLSESTFWVLLGSYWGLVMFWTWYIGVYDKPRYPRRLIPLSALIVGVCFMEAGVSKVLGPLSSTVRAGAVVVFVYAATYILAIRTYALRRGVD